MLQALSKAQLKGRAELASLTVASTKTSIHQDAITTHPNHNNCYRCRYHHQPNDCPARGQRCYYCNNIEHFSHLCKSRYTNSHRYNTRRPSHRRHSRRSLSRSSSRSSSRSRSHNRCTRKHRSPTPHPIHTLTITGPTTAPTNNTEDNSTQLKKCIGRCPTPLPTRTFTFPSFSNTEDPEDTASEARIIIHSQDEDDTDYNTISPPRHYHIPMTPPRTCKAMLPRPPYITAADDTQDQNSTADSELPISDTETESSYTPQPEDTKLSSLQDHL